MGVSMSFLSRILNGKKAFPVDRLQQIADILGKDISYLLGLPQIERGGDMREKMLHRYLYSCGISFDKKGRAVLESDNLMPRMISPADYERMVQQIDCTVSMLIESAFDAWAVLDIPQARTKRPAKKK